MARCTELLSPRAKGTEFVPKNSANKCTLVSLSFFIQKVRFGAVFATLFICSNFLFWNEIMLCWPGDFKLTSWAWAVLLPQPPD